MMSTRDSWETDQEDEEEDGINVTLTDREENSSGKSDSCKDNSLISEYMQWKDALNGCAEALEKKEASLQSELQKAEKIEETIQRAELITSNMYVFTSGVRSATVNDWNRNGMEVELTLDDAYDSASAEADALFQQARKVKRGSQIVRPMLDEVENAKEILLQIQQDFESALMGDGSVNESVFRLLQKRLQQTSKNTGFREPTLSNSGAGSSQKTQSINQGSTKKPVIGTPASNLRKFISPGGCVVIVGRNRKGNEYLTFNVAKGDDIWMHARGCPGAHVLIQKRRGSPPVTEECMQFAANLAVFYSDARSEASYDVTTTEPKHLLKPRGAPLGAVKLRQESGTVVGRPNNVPGECKQARDASGQDTEYRFQDKAKHRRRTREATKKASEKRRRKK
jgi:predicted ribosome quality control (RQC) complex YloA/Tae2 family protein